MLLYNTLTNSKQEFVTIEPGVVTMYVCGVTVYDKCHIGHARTYVVWDALRRYLQSCGYKVRYVQNFTDIDDKIINKALLTGLSWEEVVSENIQGYFEDLDDLNVQHADEYPRVTESIPQIIKFIEDLLTKGIAYQSGGDVYYSIEKFPSYGRLSNKDLSHMLTDSDSTHKLNQLDFVLWKAAKPNEPYWEGPFGKGRPGWHIECSAMIKESLGLTIDIHAGGEDLVFPHHENEIAQSEACHNHPLANYWLHNAFVSVEGTKMGKSLGNFLTIDDAIREYGPMPLRLLILQSHYRTAINFTKDSLKAAAKAWDRIELALSYRPERILHTDRPFREPFIAALEDDFNTPQALAVVFDLVKKVLPQVNNKLHGQPCQEVSEEWNVLVELLTLLGFNIPFKVVIPFSVERIERLIQQRQTAKSIKDYATADAIRADLLKEGTVLVDHKDKATTWYRS